MIKTKEKNSTGISSNKAFDLSTYDHRSEEAFATKMEKRICIEKLAHVWKVERGKKFLVILFDKNFGESAWLAACGKFPVY